MPSARIRQIEAKTSPKGSRISGRCRSRSGRRTALAVMSGHDPPCARDSRRLRADREPRADTGTRRCGWRSAKSQASSWTRVSPRQGGNAGAAAELPLPRPLRMRVRSWRRNSLSRPLPRHRLRLSEDALHHDTSAVEERLHGHRTVNVLDFDLGSCRHRIFGSHDSATTDFHCRPVADRRASTAKVCNAVRLQSPIGVTSAWMLPWEADIDLRRPWELPSTRWVAESSGWRGAGPGQFRT
jgi:hypothetical protein